MAYRWAGYYLVQGVDRPREDGDANGGEGLPDVLWSLSDCVSYLYPGPWSAAEGLEDGDLEGLMEALGVDEAGWQNVLASIDGLERTGALLWPHAFADADAARRFARSHLRQLADLRLLSIALPEDLVEGFLAEAGSDGDEAFSVVELLQRNQPVDEGAGTALGFEILGWDEGGFHSHLCNDLAPVFAKRLGIGLNEAGLITDETDARRAAELATDPATDADRCLWLPWRVSDLGLT